MRRIVRLAILLGQRANEIGGMRRSELSADLRLWTIPASRMKAKAEHILPLPPQARAIIAEALTETEGAIVFPNRGGRHFRSTSLSHSMAKLQPALCFTDANGEPNPAKLHDLRRTMATGLQHLGVAHEVIKAALAHTPMSDVTTAHYAQSSLCREVREALIRWQGAVTQMVRGEDPFAFHTEDADEMERRILGQDQLVTVEAPQGSNIVPLKKVG
jgi:integrase